MNNNLPKSKCKIAFCIDTLKEDLDGVSNTYHRLFERIPTDIEICVITPQPAERTHFNFCTSTCHSLPVPLYPAYRFALPSSKEKRILDHFNPDIIHWSTPSLLGKFALKYADLKKIPTTAIYHTHFPAYAQHYTKNIPFATSGIEYFCRPMLNAYQRATTTLAPSEAIKKFLTKRGHVPDTIAHWGRGVDTQRFTPKWHQPKYWKKNNTEDLPIALFVSRLVKIKDTDALIKIYQTTKQQCHWVVVGEGPDRKRMQRKMPQATFMGHLAGESLSKAYASADLFIFPSATETFGNVVLEAMASGLPVFATNRGGPCDLIRNNNNGFLFEPGATQEFSEQIRKVLATPTERNRLAENARRDAKRHNWDQLACNFFTLLRKTAGHP